ncbi:MAG: L,D-transpeptidase family protein [Novosphingobium sp.]|uniref:L,D-transpeptidase family protein n=1 Tax=Novosphingobium sp. TaxID=1874826 RepID=UPI0030189509
MSAQSLVDLLRTRWVSAPLGFVAMALASLLAFHVGKDVAQVLFGGSEAEAHVVAPTAADPAPRPALAAAPAPAPANSPFVVKSILKIDEPIKFGQYFWDESAAATGPIVVTVDLEARTLSVFRDGHEIGATAILKGYGNKPTPTGVFPISEKDADHVSNIYDAPMPWMLRLTSDGITIHGSKVERGYATNGCIGVPDAFAKRLFGVASLGDRVIITDGKRLGVGQPIIENAAPAPTGPAALASRDS